MSRVNLDTQHSPSASQPLLEQIHRAFGATPNMFKAVSNSPAALQSMWAAFGALGKGTIGALLGEQIAVAIANRNRCEYCLAAHTVLGQNAGATAAQMGEAQVGRSADARTAAALDFALKVIEQRAQVSEADVAALRAAGFGDEQVVEILAHVALNLFTNYVNVAFDVPVDFPKVALK
ncbi:carboxymuconolactone decarboxylase family protein [Herbaspirillum robiniae]|uniref:Carboxymuconolactone decarboxylase n=1 Tax=Herbaspirillum robiniae TaxID=2014887 RepID=A0ABX2M035_9BURK|nr:carboxymuconolactone decarboxylase family protein [Herbaspirillum robiniae]NUU02973.1 carboxymuconolactone decarboxylase [Herbaspirillum robiniae]